ncbi:hypothetical protein [uncultured Robinsoniella sp.]|uniref:hypothetical protein n=1 Tax=Robinsoniella sp. TaxID=2496533 RepID=UPI00374F4140
MSIDLSVCMMIDLMIDLMIDCMIDWKIYFPESYLEQMIGYCSPVVAVYLHWHLFSSLC